MNPFDQLRAMDERRQMFWLVFIWLLLGAVLWLWWDERSLPDISGRWASVGCETVRSSDGVSHLKREMRLDGEAWMLRIEFFADERCETPLLGMELEGPYDLGPKSMDLRGATTARFDHRKVVLTPRSEAMADAFSSARCGDGAWKVGEGQEVTQTGCLGLVPTVSSCPVEYDIVKIEDGWLCFGDRSEGLCAPDRYPARFAPHALMRDDS